MARPRKPTALLELTGAFKHDPQRRRPDEPKPDGPLGPPPAAFGDDLELKSIWEELAEIVPANVLTSADRWLVELTCRVMMQIRSGETVAAKEGVLLNCLSRMGLTPADRSRITLEPKGKSTFDDLAALARETENIRTQ
jgi:hypothetical protein